MTRHRLPARVRLGMWNHRRRNPSHDLLARSVSTPMFDLSARGYLVTCDSCDKTWAG